MRNDVHLDTGSEPGGALPEVGRDLELPDDWAFLVDQETRFRASVLRQLAKAPVPRSCLKCWGRAPGCCYQAVGVTLFEAIVVVLGAQRVVRANLPRLRARAIEELEHFGTVEFDPGEVPTQEARADWFLARRACPFLTPGGRCSIYAVRPLPCSTHNSLGSPADCSPDVVVDTPALELPGIERAYLERIAPAAEAMAIPMRLYIGIASAIMGAWTFCNGRGLV